MRKQKLYGLEAVVSYTHTIPADTLIEWIEGCLLDTMIIYHRDDLIEVFEETYLNEWSSAYVRHIYKKGLPARFIDALEAQERRYTEE